MKSVFSSRLSTLRFLIQTIHIRFKQLTSAEALKRLKFFLGILAAFQPLADSRTGRIF